MSSNTWSMSKPPPKGHADVGPFFYGLFEDAEKERERLGEAERWEFYHMLRRASHWGKTKPKQKGSVKATINLVAANINRQLAILTQAEQIPQAVCLDNIDDLKELVLKREGIINSRDISHEITSTENVASQGLKNWWERTDQQLLVRKTVDQMLSYGPTVEKYIWDRTHNRPHVLVCDIFGIYPAKGVWHDIAADAPYVCHRSILSVGDARKRYKNKNVKPDPDAKGMGEDRDLNRPVLPQNAGGAGGAQVNYSGTRSITSSVVAEDSNASDADTVAVVEVWFRDYATESYTVQIGTDVVEEEFADGDEINIRQIEKPITETRERLKYPGGIRMVAVANDGAVVLGDYANPSINPNLNEAQTSKTYFYDRFPFTMGGSLWDSSATWPYTEIEQTYEIQLHIDDIVSRLIRFTKLQLWPPLIVVNGSGVTRDQLSNNSIGIIRPNSMAHAQSIRFLQVPSASRDLYSTIGLLRGFFDLIWAIQDVDRGERPSGIISGSAISSLQERNLQLIQGKMLDVTKLVRERGRAWIALQQNWGLETERISVANEPAEYQGVIDFLGRKMDVRIENSATVSRNKAQEQALAIQLYQLGAIDREKLFSMVGVPDAQEVLERTGEGMVDQAIQVLMQAGISGDVAQQIKEMAMQYQGGPGMTGARTSANVPLKGVSRTAQGLPPSG